MAIILVKVGKKHHESNDNVVTDSDICRSEISDGKTDWYNVIHELLGTQLFYFVDKLFNSLIHVHINTRKSTCSNLDKLLHM